MSEVKGGATGANKRITWDPYGGPINENYDSHVALNSKFFAIGVGLSKVEGSEGTMPAARWDNVTDIVWLGLAQQFTDADQKQVQQLFEIGSDEMYSIPGRTFHNFTINGVLLARENYLFTMYNGMMNRIKKKLTDKYNATVANGVTTAINANKLNAPGTTADGKSGFFFNIQSPIFDRPICLVVAIANPEVTVGGYTDLVTAYALEKAYISNYNISTSAGDVVIYESLSGTYTRKRPLIVDSNTENEVAGGNAFELE